MAAVAAAIGAALVGALATWAATRAQARPVDRGVALAELQAALAEQRIMIDRGDDRIARLESEVAECERGRALDRARLEGEIAALRREVRGTP